MNISLHKCGTEKEWLFFIFSLVCWHLRLFRSWCGKYVRFPILQENVFPSHSSRGRGAGPRVTFHPCLCHNASDVTRSCPSPMNFTSFSYVNALVMVEWTEQRRAWATCDTRGRRGLFKDCVEFTVSLLKQPMCLSFRSRPFVLFSQSIIRLGCFVILPRHFVIIFLLNMTLCNII